jgi:hypothetical protein
LEIAVAIKANIVIDQGTDFSAVIDVSDAENEVYNLSGFTVAAQMRKNYASLIAVTFVASHNGSLGQIFLELSKNITSDLELGRYLYDVEITGNNGEGSTIRVVEGIATVTPGITRV